MYAIYCNNSHGIVTPCDRIYGILYALLLDMIQPHPLIKALVSIRKAFL